MSDFSTDFGMKRPDVPIDLVPAFARERFGVIAQATELGSNQDRNFLLLSPAGERRLLKIDNPVFRPAEIDAQTRGLQHVAAAGILAPQPLPGVDGETLQALQAPAAHYRARLLSFVEGTPVADAPRLGHHDGRRLGALAGRLSAALADFRHPGLDRHLQWDMRHSAAVIEQLLGSVRSDGLRERLAAAADDAWRRVQAVADHLPVAPLHGDLTPDNVVRTADDRLAVIDFGDLALGWRVAEIAVTAAGILTRAEGDASIALSAIEAFAAEAPLSPAEAEAVWPLVVLRGCVLVVSGIHQGSLDADNDYVQERLAEELAVFETAAAIDPDLAAATVAGLIGLPAPSGVAADLPSEPALPITPMLDSVPVPLDLAPTSPLVGDGRWRDGAAARELLIREARTGAAAVLLPHGRPDLTRSAALDEAAPVNVPLGVTIDLDPGAVVRAPHDAVVVERDADGLTLVFAGTRLQISGIRPDPADAVAAGDRLGTTTGRLRLVWSPVDAPAPPDAAAEPWATGWRRLTLDPSPLLGAEPLAPLPAPEAEAARKARVFAAAQENYYDRPPLIVRGWRSRLIDVTGRPYLDMVNNVSSIGHAHPRLTRAVAAQMATLNTNSRFLYPQIADLSERLLATMPDGMFDTVLLVNSGTEAIDLALRLAGIATGRRDVVAVREGYHGWSLAADAVSTSAFDNPGALASRPDWVHIAEAPNPYRGPHRGDGAGAAYLDGLRAQLAGLVQAGRPPAAYVVEPIHGNGGGVIPPAGYIAGAFDAVRAVGGLAIADEVQVGLGRLGRAFWGFVDQGATPDIVVTAKALGNAFPVGAVITRREIADALGKEGQFFSSAGGAPASCAAALAVLDVIRDEGLVENARSVGDVIRRGLEALATRHPLIGALHGTGLYQGVELVTDRDRRTPAVRETAAACERLGERGVIVQPTSERQNVLKVKPPLTLTHEEAAFFVDAVDRTLTEIG